MKNNAQFKKLINGLFLIALCVPFLAVLRSPHLKAVVRSVVENPSSWNGQRDVLRRSTPLWNKAVEGYTSLLFALGTTSSRDVGVVGTDHWIFLGDGFDHNFSQALGRRKFSIDELERWHSVLSLQQAWLARRQIPMLFVVAPAKWSIYPEKLPAWSQREIGEHAFDGELAIKGDLHMVDLRPTLRAARKEADTYSPLNSHWTDFGAFVAWRALVPELGSLATNLQGLYIPPYNGVSQTDYGSEFAGLLSLPVSNRWTIPNFTQPFPDFQGTDANGHVTSFPGLTRTGLLDLPRETVAPAVKNNIRALIMRDSMGDSLSLYLQAAFHETKQVDHHINVPALAPNLPSLVDSYRPNLLMYVMTERYFDHVPRSDEVQFWQAANDFDLASSVGAWTNDGSGSGVVRLEGSPDLNTAASLYWSPEDKESLVLRIDLDASWSGQLQLQFYADNKLQLEAEQYVAGNNELFFKLPAGVAGSRVTVVRGEGSASVRLNDIMLKKLH
ncbi:alginate O-acetyltransferase AlgX-related protein [Dyella sp.]|uniref:alginate O-acetyltransferase AlgX-related protein n=1 Tax=Dyella sp. TaxID=1869338 RepID=UPI002ED59E83